MSQVVISFANNRGNYYLALERLRRSMEQFWGGPFFGFKDEWTIGAQLHTDNPYAFKLHCINAALGMGYRQILYVDSSVYAVRPIKPIFDVIESEGYFMQEAGQYLRNWINEPALKYFKTTKEELGDQVMYGNAGLLGLNFDTQIAKDFYNEWQKAKDNGVFKGSWDDHRHDMTAGSVIANRLGMKFKKGDEWMEYAPPEAPMKNETILLKAQGL